MACACAGRRGCPALATPSALRFTHAHAHTRTPTHTHTRAAALYLAVVFAVAIGHSGGVLCLVAMTLVGIILCRPAQHTFTSSMGVQIVPSCATVDLEGVSQNPALLTVHLWILCLACRARRRGQFAASHDISCRSLAYNHKAGLCCTLIVLLLNSH